MARASWRHPRYLHSDQLHEHSQHIGTWDCSGTFASEDGSLRIPNTLLGAGHQRNGDRVSAAVAAAGSSDAWSASSGTWWAMPALQLALCITGGAVYAAILYSALLTIGDDHPGLLSRLRNRRTCRRPVTGAGIPPVTHPRRQRTNRARKRRRLSVRKR